MAVQTSAWGELNIIPPNKFHAFDSAIVFATVTAEYCMPLDSRCPHWHAKHTQHSELQAKIDSDWLIMNGAAAFQHRLHKVA